MEFWFSYHVASCGDISMVLTTQAQAFSCGVLTKAETHFKKGTL